MIGQRPTRPSILACRPLITAIAGRVRNYDCARIVRNQKHDRQVSRMALRTAEQYKQSLRDGRAVFYRGERVPDVTAHPVIALAVAHACSDYRIAEDPKIRHLP